MSAAQPRNTPPRFTADFTFISHLFHFFFNQEPYNINGNIKKA